MYDEKTREIHRLLFQLDMWIALLMLILAYHLKTALFGVEYGSLMSHIALFPIIWIPLGYMLNRYGVYDGLRIYSKKNYILSVAKSLIVAMSLLVAMIYMLGTGNIGRSFLILYAIMEFGALLIVRWYLNWWYFRKSVEKVENFLKVLIIGTGERAKKVAKTIHEHSEWGVDIIGFLDKDNNMVGKSIEGKKVIGTINHVGDILTSRVVDEVVLAVPRTMISDVESIVQACEIQGVKFRWMADIFDMRVSRVRLVALGAVPMLTFEPVAQNEQMLLMKRLFDITVILLSMPVVLPVMLAVALAVKLDSPGPVFFYQKRVGLRKRIFPMMKFRSMYIDAEERLKEIEHLNEADGPIFKIKNDPRITRVGKFIRKTSLDEIPQLLNVIRGHMSLVGPRPMSIRDVDLFDREIQRKRFSVRPGLTCIWQISGRSELTFDEWLELDLKYINNWSFWLDIKLLFKTIPVVLKGSGAS